MHDKLRTRTTVPFRNEIILNEFRTVEEISLLIFAKRIRTNFVSVLPVRGMIGYTNTENHIYPNSERWRR